jgi:hypothetical protein
MRRSLLLIVGCVLLAGCGSGGTSTSKPDSTARTSPAASNPSASLESAVRTALHENAKLSDYVLSHNAVPTWAKRSTAGPALAALRSAAAHRKAGRVQVRLLDSTIEVQSVKLDPSYVTATAAVVERSRVRLYQRGRAIGGVRTLNEPATVELRRQGDKSTFLVWKVAPTR